MSLDDCLSGLLALLPVIPFNNVTRTPAISLPLGKDPNGMPLAAHFMAPIGREDRLFNHAGQLERTSPWWNERPAVYARKTENK